ncbi:hypothetical protein [Methylomagnum sp.]
MRLNPPQTLRIAGLLLAVSALSSGPVLTGYDAATGATATTPTPAPAPSNPAIVAQVKDTAGTRTKGSFTRTIAAKQEKFTGTLKIPLPSPALGITDAATAGDTEVLLEFTRNGMAYADCSLDFTGTTKKPFTANYKVDLLKRRGALQQKTGYCELLVTPRGPGLPQPAARDRMRLRAIGAAGNQLFAEGTFNKK